MFDSSMNIFPTIFVIKILLFAVASWIVDFFFVFLYEKREKWKNKKSIFLHWFRVNPIGQMYMASKAKIHPNWDRHTANGYVSLQSNAGCLSTFEKIKNELKDSTKMNRKSSLCIVIKGLKTFKPIEN